MLYPKYVYVLNVDLIVGPAPDSITNKIFDISKEITDYKLCVGIEVDITKVGTQIFSVSFFI